MFVSEMEEVLYVSVPLRGKEGAGHCYLASHHACHGNVSVPLRGKEGAGPGKLTASWKADDEFPSPCGVRRVRDTIQDQKQK